MDYNIEESMKPGKLSVGGFLGEGEILSDVIKTDDETVKNLGLTHEEIANRIEYFINAAGDYPTMEGKHVDGNYLVGGRVWRGGQECPWGDTKLTMPYGNMDLYVENLELGERLNFPGGIVHLIREHGFYEGKESPYRVDPEKAVRVLGLK